MVIGVNQFPGLQQNIPQRFALGQQNKRTLQSQDLGNQQRQQAIAAGQQQQQARQLSGNILGGGQAQPGQPQVNQEQQLAKLFRLDPELGKKTFEAIGAKTQRQQDEASLFAFKAANLPLEQQNTAIQERIDSLTTQGRDPKDTQSLLSMPPEQRAVSLKAIQLSALTPKQRSDIEEGRAKTKNGEPTAKQREFESLSANLSANEKERARRIGLGLDPRAVGSAAQTIADAGTAEKVGESQATIKEREKFGELTGSSRAKAIDSGFEKITKITSNIRNLDRAIKAVEGGAGTGALEKRFPSIKAASVELDQIQGELALDVVGAVQFGALSEGELELAKQIALPTGLEGPQLIDHLKRRKEAQSKLLDYFQEQIDFLDTGGSIAGFLRGKERQGEGTSQQQTGGITAEETQRGGQVMVDGAGNRAIVFPDKTVRELR